MVCRTLSVCVVCCALLLFGNRVVYSQTAGGSLDVPQTRLAPLGTPTAPAAPSFGAAGPVSGQAFGAPAPLGVNPNAAGLSSFDPYAGAPAAGFVQPMAPATIGGGGLFGAAPATAPQGGFFAPSMPSTTFGTPVYGGLANQPPPMLDAGGLFGGSAGGFPGATVPGGYAGGYAGAPPSYGFPQSAYPSASPSSLFPGGLFGPTPSFSPQFNPYRLIQRGRFRHTYIHDDNSSNGLLINDTDVAFAFAIPSFLASTQPLYITPSFSIHLWDGPLASSGADLPGSAFSAFLDFSWQSDPIRIVGTELGVSVGAFSEFDVYDSDSLRIRGKGLGTFRVTPTTMFKLGVYYYDRVDIKLLPAVGFFYRPNPFTKIDLFFPQPKYSRYLSTVGTNEVWWYVSGEYGGGSWSIERDDGRDDQVDINDIRLMLGFEWGEGAKMRVGMRTMFFEFGYVGGRDLVYRHNPQDNLDLGDTWMFRLGLGY